MDVSREDAIEYVAFGFDIDWRSVEQHMTDDAWKKIARE